jgi:hypothetical protein
MQTLLPEGWMQFLEEDTLRIRYMNTVSMKSHYEDRYVLYYVSKREGVLGDGQTTRTDMKRNRIDQVYDSKEVRGRQVTCMGL